MKFQAGVLLVGRPFSFVQNASGAAVLNQMCKVSRTGFRQAVLNAAAVCLIFHVPFRTSMIISKPTKTRSMIVRGVGHSPWLGAVLLVSVLQLMQMAH